MDAIVFDFDGTLVAVLGPQCVPNVAAGASVVARLDAYLTTAA